MFEEERNTSHLGTANLDIHYNIMMVKGDDKKGAFSIKTAVHNVCDSLSEDHNSY